MDESRKRTTRDVHQHAERPRILVLMGGPDAEHDVSVQSGRAVADALHRCDRFAVVERIIESATADDLLAESPDAIFPVLHGPWGEGGPLQQVLEALQRDHHIGYVGSGPDAAALCMDKYRTKQALAEATSIPSPQAAVFNPALDACPLAPPVVIKPVDDGSSVGVSLCHNATQVDQATRQFAIEGRAQIMAERLIPGREITVGILFGRALPLIEIVPNVTFYDYQAKYERDDTRYVINPLLDASSTSSQPAKIGAAHLTLQETIQRHACTAFRTLGCRDLARVDFMLDERGPWFLEINTMPGFTSHSLVPMAARDAGLEMPALCAQLIEAALQRAATAAAAHQQPATRA